MSWTRREFLATAAAAAATATAAPLDDEAQKLFAKLKHDIIVENPSLSDFKIAYGQLELKDSNFKPDTTFTNTHLSYLNGEPQYEQQETLLSLAFQAQRINGREGQMYFQWNPERSKIIDFLIKKGADINKTLDGKPYEGAPRKVEGVPAENVTIGTTIFERAATQEHAFRDL